MLIAKRIYCPDFIAIAERELCFGLIIRFKVGILDTVFRLQAYPFDIMFLGHGVVHGANGYMNDISLNFVYRDMLLAGCFRRAGNQFLHFFATAVDGHAFIPDYSHDISAMLTSQKFLFYLSSLLQKVCPDSVR